MVGSTYRIFFQCSASITSLPRKLSYPSEARPTVTESPPAPRIPRPPRRVVTYAGSVAMRSANRRTFATPTAIAESTRTSARRSASRRRTRSVALSASRSIPNASSRNALRHRQLVVAPNQPLTWIELTFAVMPSASIIATIRSTCLRRQRRDVLAEIDREVGLAIVLVGGERRTRHRGEDLLADARQLRAMGRARSASSTTNRLTSLRDESRRSACRTRRSRRRRASTGHMRAMWSHQPAGRPVIGTTSMPAARSRSSAA